MIVRSAGGSGASSSASPPATCSASPTCPRSDASSPRWRRRASRPRCAPRRPTRRSRSSGWASSAGASSTTRATSTCCSCTTATTAEAERAARAVLATMSDAVARTASCSAPTPNLRPEGRSGALTRTLDSYAAYYEQWARTWEFQALIKAAPVAGDAALGAAVHRAHAATRVAGHARPRRGPRDPRDEGARREHHRAQGTLGTRAQARARRHPRHRVRGAAAAARARPARPDGPHRRRPSTRCSTLAGGGYVERADADRSRRRLPLPPHRRAPAPARTTSSRRTRSRPTPQSRRRLARVLGYRGDPDAQLARGVRGRPPRTPDDGAHDPRAPVLRAAARDPRRRRPALPGGRRGAARRVRLHRRRTHTRRGARAHRRAHPALAAHAAAAPGHPRVALGHRPIPTSGCSSCDDSPKAPLVRRRSPPRSATRPARRSGRAGSSARAAWSGDALRRHPEFVDDLGDDDALGRREDPRRARRRRARDAGVARRPARPTRGSPPLQAARAAAHRRAAISSASHRSKPPNGSSPGSPRRASRRRCRSLDPPLPFAVIGMGRLGGAELSYASDIDVLFVYDGDASRRLRRRRARRHASSSPRSARRRPRARRSASTRGSAPRATRGRSRARSTVTPATTTNGA